VEVAHLHHAETLERRRQLVDGHQVAREVDLPHRRPDGVRHQPRDHAEREAHHDGEGDAAPRRRGFLVHALVPPRCAFLGMHGRRRHVGRWRRRRRNR
jgi:hypothetical protein